MNELEIKAQAAMAAYRVGGSKAVEAMGYTAPKDCPSIGRWLDEPALRARLRTTARARRMTLTGWPETADEVGRVLEEVR